MPETNPNSSRPRNAARFAVMVVISSLVAMGALALLVNIFEHKQEARNPFFRVVELTDETDDGTVGFATTLTFNPASVPPGTTFVRVYGGITCARITAVEPRWLEDSSGNRYTNPWFSVGP